MNFEVQPFPTTPSLNIPSCLLIDEPIKNGSRIWSWNGIVAFRDLLFHIITEHLNRTLVYIPTKRPDVAWRQQSKFVAHF